MPVRSRRSGRVAKRHFCCRWQRAARQPRARMSARRAAAHGHAGRLHMGAPGGCTWMTAPGGDASWPCAAAVHAAGLPDDVRSDLFVPPEVRQMCTTERSRTLTYARARSGPAEYPSQMHDRRRPLAGARRGAARAPPGPGRARGSLENPRFLRLLRRIHRAQVLLRQHPGSAPPATWSGGTSATRRPAAMAPRRDAGGCARARSTLREEARSRNPCRQKVDES